MKIQTYKYTLYCSYTTEGYSKSIFRKTCTYCDKKIKRRQKYMVIICDMDSTFGLFAHKLIKCDDCKMNEML